MKLLMLQLGTLVDVVTLTEMVIGQFMVTGTLFVICVRYNSGLQDWLGCPVDMTVLGLYVANSDG